MGAKIKMLIEKKEELLYWAKRAENSGLCIPKVGNFSLCDPESGLIVMTPSGQDRHRCEAHSMAVLDLEGEWLDGDKPTSEFQMHLSIYKARPDIHAIAHTHSRFATVLAVWEKPIPPVVYEVLMFGGSVPVAPYARPGTEDLATVVGTIFTDSDACLLARHGALVGGRDCEDAFLKALYVEETAAVYYHSLMLGQGKEPPLLELEEVKAWQYPEIKSSDSKK